MKLYRTLQVLLAFYSIIHVTSCTNAASNLNSTSSPTPTTEKFSVTVISPISPVSGDTVPTRSPRTLIITPHPTGNLDEDVIITEVFHSEEHEYVLIENNSSTKQEIGGWYLLNPRSGSKFLFPEELILPISGSVRIHSGPGGIDDPPTDLYWSKESVWDRSSGDVVLLNPAGRVMFWYVFSQ